MKKIHFLFFATALLFSTFTYGQRNPDAKKIKISGIIIEKSSKIPLEYATINFLSTKNTKTIEGGITNAKGEFEVEINPGTYIVKAEFSSFKITEIKEQNFTESKNIGVIFLEENPTQLGEVIVRAEKTTIDLKLDKKVYSVGQDLMVKGGTVSDVLDNIPSVAVHSEGNISLRGNENVRILIDGKPSNAVNINEALRLIPANAIDKVEVITNPSARYDAEGGGGILNIILKVGKNQGVNGNFILSSGTPENTGISGNFNIKSNFSNIFATIGYNKRNNPGNMEINQTRFNDYKEVVSYLEERRNNDKRNEGINGNFGIELFLDKKSSWTNTFIYRKNKGTNPENVIYSEFLNTGFEKRQRYNYLNQETENVEFTTNYIKKFKKEGNKLTIDGAFSVNKDNDSSVILGNKIIPTPFFLSSETTLSKQKQSRNLFQTDYVLPLGEKSQFETGFRGNYLTLFSNFKVTEDILGNNIFTENNNFTGTLEYKENVNAFYTQFGSKFKKFSYLLGLRLENSNIEVNLLKTQEFNTKNYNNFFPSAFLSYEIKQGSNISISYSKRITRPRDRFINPFASYSSNINLFQGNPNINPAMTDALDLGYLKKWDNLTLNTSLYYNLTHDAFQIARINSGRVQANNPVIINTPFNLDSDTKIGFEFTLNYSPFKWWKLNGNFNYFNNETKGKYIYTNAFNKITTINFDNQASSWTTRLTSKISLPYKVDFQINGTYNGKQKTAQGQSKANGNMNLALSKDILKDKGTLAFNISDVFNSKKRIQEVNLPNFRSNSEMQWRERQITLIFTYRFNKTKQEKEKLKRENENGSEDF